MTDQNLTPEAVERLAAECKEMGNQAHAQIGASKYMRALWKADDALRALAQHTAALQAEVERLTKERDAQYDENVHRIAMQAKSEAERDEARSMLADAERDMRQRAADLCDCACMDGIGDKIRAIGDEILALPLKHADREGGV